MELMLVQYYWYRFLTDHEEGAWPYVVGVFWKPGNSGQNCLWVYFAQNILKHAGSETCQT